MTVIKNSKYLLFFIFPFCLLWFTHQLDQSLPSHNTVVAADPEYIYLLNFLRLSDFHLPTYIDHPGLTLNLLGASIIKVHFLTQSIKVQDIAVISHPEYYLKHVHHFLIFLDFVVLLLSGFFIFYITDFLSFGLIFQATLFSSLSIFTSLTRVTPEHLLIPICLLYSLVLIAPIKFNLEKYLKIYQIIFGVILSLGFCTKLTFLPLMIIPFLLMPNLKERFVLGFWLIGFLIVMTFPIWPKLPSMMTWMASLLIHSGRYGSGNSNFIEPSQFFINLFGGLRTHPYFSFVLMISLIFFLRNLNHFRKERSGIIPTLRIFSKKVIFAIIVAQLGLLLLASKHFAPRYLISGLLLSGPLVIVLLHEILKSKNYGWLNRIVILIPITFVIFFYVSGKELLENIKARNLIACSVSNLISEQVQLNKVIHNYGSSSMSYALHLGDHYAGYRYAVLRKSLFSNDYYYDNNTKLYSDGRNTISLKTILQGNSNVLFRGNNPNDFYDDDGHPLLLKPLLASKNENIYSF